VSCGSTIPKLHEISALSCGGAHNAHEPVSDLTEGYASYTGSPRFESGPGDLLHVS
jgi:hypothetical protein